MTNKFSLMLFHFQNMRTCSSSFFQCSNGPAAVSPAAAGEATHRWNPSDPFPPRCEASRCRYGRCFANDWFCFGTLLWIRKVEWTTWHRKPFVDEIVIVFFVVLDLKTLQLAQRFEAQAGPCSAPIRRCGHSQGNGEDHPQRPPRRGEILVPKSFERRQIILYQY